MNAILSLPRVQLGAWPTPLQPADQLSLELGCPLFIKREDMTVLGGGGNKARKLEFQLGQAKEDGATHIITTGAVQSNHAHFTAAASRKLGLKPHLVLSGQPDIHPHGNLYLDRLMNSELTFVTPPAGRPPLEVMNEVMEQIAENITREGGKPCIIPEGGTDALGTVGYILAFEELVEQLSLYQLDSKRVLIAVATGTVLAYHLMGSAGYWIGDVVGGIPSDRVRANEFVVQGDHTQLEELLEKTKKSLDQIITRIPGVDRPKQGVVIAENERFTRSCRNLQFRVAIQTSEYNFYK